MLPSYGCRGAEGVLAEAEQSQVELSVVAFKRLPEEVEFAVVVLLSLLVAVLLSVVAEVLLSVLVEVLLSVVVEVLLSVVVAELQSQVDVVVVSVVFTTLSTASGFISTATEIDLSLEPSSPFM